MVGSIVPQNPYLPASFYDNQGNLTVSQQTADMVSKGVQDRMKDMPEAERKLFQALVQSSTLAPGDTSSQKNIDKALDRLEKAVDLFATAVTADMATLFARIMIEQMSDQRKAALEDRLASRMNAKAELLDQAGKLKDSANQMMIGAIVSLVIGVVASAVSIAGSISSMTKSVGSAKDMQGTFGKMSKIDDIHSDVGKQEFALLTQEMTQLGQLAQKGNLIGQISNLVNSLGQSISGASTGISQAASKNTEAEGSASAARAEDDRAQGDIAKSVQDNLQELLKSIIAFLRDMQENQVQMMQSLTKV